MLVFTLYSTYYICIADKQRPIHKSPFCVLQVRDMSTLLTFMRYNDWENDPLSAVRGCHPGEGRTPAGAIANR